MLKAFFLAAVQILVYAGAVIVLFLFVIMLLDIKEEERQRFRRFGTLLGVSAVAGLAWILITTVSNSRAGERSLADNAGETKPLGELLFSNYVLPFEIVSLLLLVAMVGCILLSKTPDPGDTTDIANTADTEDALRSRACAYSRISVSAYPTVVRSSKKKQESQKQKE